MDDKEIVVFKDREKKRHIVRQIDRQAESEGDIREKGKISRRESDR